MKTSPCIYIINSIAHEKKQGGLVAGESAWLKRLT